MIKDSVSDSEYADFLRGEGQVPSVALSREIAERVHRDLNPSFLRVLGKLFGIHVVIGGLSLLFCPQFGVSPLNTHGFMGYFMALGVHGCLAACGATFMAGSALFAGILLRPEELRVLRRTRVLQFLILGSVSLGGFAVVGASLVFSLALVWLIGVLVSGIISLEVGFQFMCWTRGTVRRPTCG